MLVPASQNFFKSKAKSLAEWDRHILKNRHQLMALQVRSPQIWNILLDSFHHHFISLVYWVVGRRPCSIYLHLYLLSLILLLFQVDLGKASTSQDRLERQLDILQVHQKQISDALNVMEAEAEHLSRWVLCVNITPCSRAKLTFHIPPLVLRRSPQHSAALESQTSSSQDTLYSLAESISAHLSSLGDALHGIVPSNADGEEVRNIKKILRVAYCTQLRTDSAFRFPFNFFAGT